MTQAVRARRVFPGWWVALTGFLMALFAWGLGFYGPGIYLAWLSQRRGWPVGEISQAITVYYIVSALIVMATADLYERAGHRATVLVGVLALAAGALAMPAVDTLWQLYAGFLVMAVGWAILGSAGVNTVIAPWFERRRGMVVSLALNGASLGGVLIAPSLVWLAQRLGTAQAVGCMVALMAAILVPFALATLHRRPEDLGLAADGGIHGAASKAAAAEPLTPRRELLRRPAFWSVAVPFSLALMAQVGFLTHEFAFLGPLLGTDAAAAALSLTTAMAVVGRLATGLVVDRVDRRLLAAANFAMQAAAVACLALVPHPALLWAACVVFGLGVGNQITLSPLIVQSEFRRRDFARVVALVVAVTQVTYAFGPGVMGTLADATGGYGAALWLATALLAAAAVGVIAGRRR